MKIIRSKKNKRPLPRIAAPSAARAGAEVQREKGELGFTLLECTIGLVLLTIVALGTAHMFSLSIYHNSGGSDRAASLAIAQQTLETLRSAQFNSTTTDAALNAGTYAPVQMVRDGRLFLVTKIIDDIPSTPGVVDVDATTTLKAISISVRPQSIGQGWAFGSAGTVTLFTQRAKTDR